MFNLFRMLMGIPLLRPVLRPITRLLVGALAIPMFRTFLRRVVRLQDLDAELEKDLEQWFRGCLLLLVATRNMEESLFGWVSETWQGDYQWITMGLRLMLALGVIEAMPDQELFAVIHPGPPKIRFDKTRSYWSQLKESAWPVTRGVICQHINRSSPAFAILAAIAPGWIGWMAYCMAITQYLIIGLVTSRDKALDVLSVFDKEVARRREELIREFDLSEGDSAEERAAALRDSESSGGQSGRSKDADVERSQSEQGTAVS